MSYNKITSDHPRSNVSYASITLDITAPITDYNIKDNTYLFEHLNVGREIVIRNSNAIKVKFNLSSNDPIDLFNNEGINMTGIPITNIFISAQKNTVVRIWMVGWN